MCDISLTLASVIAVTVLTLTCFCLLADFDFSRIQTHTCVCVHTHRALPFFSYSLSEEISASVCYSVNHESMFYHCHRGFFFNV